jgi:Flp pilus assembly protein TadG
VARRLAGAGGAELVETALVLPILLTLLIGIFWLGRAYNIYETITRAAREGARFAVSPSCATCGNAFPSDTDVDTVINNALSASALNPTKVSPGINILRNQVLDPSAPGANQVAGVIVTFGYPVQLFIPFTSLKSSSFTITTQVQMRQEF